MVQYWIGLSPNSEATVGRSPQSSSCTDSATLASRGSSGKNVEASKVVHQVGSIDDIESHGCRASRTVFCLVKVEKLEAPRVAIPLRIFSLVTCLLVLEYMTKCDSICIDEANGSRWMFFRKATLHAVNCSNATCNTLEQVGHSFSADFAARGGEFVASSVWVGAGWKPVSGL